MSKDSGFFNYRNYDLKFSDVFLEIIILGACFIFTMITHIILVSQDIINPCC